MANIWEPYLQNGVKQIWGQWAELKVSVDSKVDKWEKSEQAWRASWDEDPTEVKGNRSNLWHLGLSGLHLFKDCIRFSSEAICGKVVPSPQVRCHWLRMDDKWRPMWCSKAAFGKSLSSSLCLIGIPSKGNSCFKIDCIPQAFIGFMQHSLLWTVTVITLFYYLIK